MVACELPKLVVRVRFPLPAPTPPDLAKLKGDLRSLKVPFQKQMP